MGNGLLWDVAWGEEKKKKKNFIHPAPFPFWGAVRANQVNHVLAFGTTFSCQNRKVVRDGLLFGAGVFVQQRFACTFGLLCPLFMHAVGHTRTQTYSHAFARSHVVSFLFVGLWFQMSSTQAVQVDIHMHKLMQHTGSVQADIMTALKAALLEQTEVSRRPQFQVQFNLEKEGRSKAAVNQLACLVVCVCACVCVCVRVCVCDQMCLCLYVCPSVGGGVGICFLFPCSRGSVLCGL